MIEHLVFSIWFFMPAGFANASPIFAKKIPILNKWTTPMDFGKSLSNKRILGDNKTWRGFIFGIFIAVLTLWLQKIIFEQSSWLQNTLVIIDYSDISLWLGVLLGAGALLGDAVESFFKRKLGIKSGESWFPYDQIDYIIGGLLLSLIIVNIPLTYGILIFIVWFLLHLISSYIGFLLNLKEKPI